MNLRSPARRITRLATLVVVVLSLTIALLPSTALAEEPVDIWQAISIVLHDLDPGKIPTLVITAQAVGGLEPPVDAALPMPKGSTLSWAGEILGGDPSADPMLVIDDVEELERYELLHFTMEYSPLAQLEIALPDGYIVQTEQGYAIDLSWVAAGEADRARVAIAVPGGYHFESTAAEPVVEIRMTDALYSIETSPVVEGQELSLTGFMLPGMAPEQLAHGTGAEEDSAAATADPPAEEQPVATTPPVVEEEAAPLSSSTLLIVLLVAVIAGLLVFMVRLVKAGNARTEEDQQQEE